MARSIAALLALAAAVVAIPSPITPDPNGDHLVGNGQGEQFITGGCLSTADCSQAVVHSCCAFISGGSSTGICSGFDVANGNGKAGCGFGDSGTASSASLVATTVAAVPAAASTASTASTASSGQCAAIDSSLAGSQNVGTASGTQFITGQCLSKADCASGCCVAQSSGISLCKAQLVTTEAGLSCDSSCSGAASASAATNDTAADTNTNTATTSTDTAATSSSASAGTCAVDSSLAGSQNVGTGTGTQFITGQCFSKSDCASGCCVAQASGINLCKAQLVTTEAGLSCDASCSGSSVATAAAPAASSSAAVAVVGATGSAQCTVDSTLSGSQNAGTGAGTQFITGQCLSKADCASGCCVAQASGASLCKAQLVTTQAGLSCDFTCSA